MFGANMKIAIWRLPAYWLVIKRWRMCLKYKRVVGVWPNIISPSNYNEFFHWRKVFDRNPVFVTLCDKIESKKFFAKHCPDLEIPDVLWSGDRAEDIPEKYFLPGFVIKVNHASARNFFSRTLDKQNRAKDISKMNSALRKGFGAKKGEWAYAKVDRKIFVEPEMAYRKKGEITELNFDVFNGEVFCAFVITNKSHGPYKYGLFWPNGNRMKTTVASMRDPEYQIDKDFKLPTTYQYAAECAAKLGKEFDQIRVDFSCKGDEIWACEMTVYSTSGYANLFQDVEIRRKLDGCWDLSTSWFFQTPQTGWRKRYAAYLVKFSKENYGKR